jgi:4-coumarate--CoA ligase
MTNNGGRRNGNEYPRAFVVRKDANLSAEEVAAHIRERLAPHKWLTGGVYFVEAIPRIASGKINKKLLPVVDDDPRVRL